MRNPNPISSSREKNLEAFSSSEPVDDDGSIDPDSEYPIEIDELIEYYTHHCSGCNCESTKTCPTPASSTATTTIPSNSTSDSTTQTEIQLDKPSETNESSSTSGVDESLFEKLERSKILYKALPIIAEFGENANKKIISYYGKKCFDVLFDDEEIRRGCYRDPTKCKIGDKMADVYDPEKRFIIYGFVGWLISKPLVFTVDEFKRYFYSNAVEKCSSLLSTDDLNNCKNIVLIRYAYERRNQLSPHNSKGQKARKRKLVKNESEHVFISSKDVDGRGINLDGEIPKKGRKH